MLEGKVAARKFIRSAATANLSKRGSVYDLRSFAGWRQFIAMTGQKSEQNDTGGVGHARELLRVLICAGIGARVALVALAGNRLLPVWSGGGDQHEYILLAQNLLAGDGFSYHHMPTAWRAPGYPILLAAFMWLFPAHWILAVRVLQLGLGILTAFVCGRIAERMFGPEARDAAVAAALWMPMMAYFQGEILTECVTSLLVALFFYQLVRCMSSDDAIALLWLGFVGGVAAIFRFNAAALPLIACAALFFWSARKNRWKRALLVGAAALITASPWLIRTARVFHGEAIYSTQSGLAEVEGVVMPLGRTQPEETQAIQEALHWGNWDVETNSASRERLPGEPELNREARRVARRLWSERGWQMLPVTLEKLGAFWLGLDQVFWTQSFSMANRALRWAGVAAYWLILALAVAGWMRLRQSCATLASVLLFFALVITALHIPLVMNTRLRSPLLDPLLAALAGGGWLAVIDRRRISRSRNA